MRAGKSARRWILRYAPRTTLATSGTVVLCEKYRFRGVGSIGSTHMNARSPRSAQLAKMVYDDNFLICQHRFEMASSWEKEMVLYPF